MSPLSPTLSLSLSPLSICHKVTYSISLTHTIAHTLFLSFKFKFVLKHENQTTLLEKKEKRNARSGVAHTPLPPAPPTSSSPLFVTHALSLMHTHPLTPSHARTHTHALFLQFNVSRYHILFFVVQQQQQRQRPSLCLASVERKKERPFCYKINRSTLTRIFIGRSQTEVRQFVFPN